jgi:hypothetical protein
VAQLVVVVLLALAVLLPAAVVLLAVVIVLVQVNAHLKVVPAQVCAGIADLVFALAAHLHVILVEVVLAVVPIHHQQHPLLVVVA